MTKVYAGKQYNADQMQLVELLCEQAYSYLSCHAKPYQIIDASNDELFPGGSGALLKRYEALKVKGLFPNINGTFQHEYG